MPKILNLPQFECHSSCEKCRCRVAAAGLNFQNWVPQHRSGSPYIRAVMGSGREASILFKHSRSVGQTQRGNRGAPECLDARVGSCDLGLANCLAFSTVSCVGG
eukprot:s639_g4.t1